MVMTTEVVNAKKCGGKKKDAPEGPAPRVFGNLSLADDATAYLQRSDITGVILAGGKSRRMGVNKALLDIDGQPLIARIFDVVAELFREVIIVTNTPDIYQFLGCRMVPDVYPGCGSIAGIHSGLLACHTEKICVVPCDAPFVSPSLLEFLCDIDADYDAIIPRSGHGMEPLQAVYRRTCVAAFEKAIATQTYALHKVLRDLHCRYLEPEEYRHISDAGLSFCNLNHPSDYQALTPEGGDCCKFS